MSTIYFMNMNMCLLFYIGTDGDRDRDMKCYVTIKLENKYIKVFIHNFKRD